MFRLPLLPSLSGFLPHVLTWIRIKWTFYVRELPGITQSKQCETAQTACPTWSAIFCPLPSRSQTCLNTILSARSFYMWRLTKYRRRGIAGGEVSTLTSWTAGSQESTQETCQDTTKGHADLVSEESLSLFCWWPSKGHWQEVPTCSTHQTTRTNNNTWSAYRTKYILKSSMTATGITLNKKRKVIQICIEADSLVIVATASCGWFNQY